MTIALMRHGQTDWNLAGRVQGHTNIPLNETGRAQAREAAEVLAAAGSSWSHITSSPLDRARETAQIVANRLTLALGSPIDTLIEQHYGDAEGANVADLDMLWPDRNFPNGEAPASVAQRALDTLELLSETHLGMPVLAVTHGAYIRRLIATLSDIDYLDAPRILNASVTTFERNMQGEWIITTINSEPTGKALTPSFVTLGDGDAGFCTVDGVCN